MTGYSWRTPLLAGVAAMLIMPAAYAARRSYDKVLDAPAGGQLSFDTDLGSVVVIGRDPSQVVIHAQLEGPESFVDHVHVTAGHDSSGVTISARAADRESPHLFSFHWFGVSWERARFVIDVPRGYPVNLRTSGGDVTVRDLSASVRAATSGGDARIESVDGRVDVSTSGGDLHLKALTGIVDVHTGGGDIEAARLDGPAKMSSSGGEMRIVDAMGGLDLRSGGGDIMILLPKSTHGSIDARSGGGSIRTSFPLSAPQAQADTHLAGTIGGGGGVLISLHSSGGDIDIGTAK